MRSPRYPDSRPSASTEVLVIGAGVNGASVGREAALCGLRTVLVDAQDFCAGTSGASSRLIHGGIRYLEHGELRLVHESLRERELLLRAAPHLVKPYPLLIPFYRHNRRSRTVIRLGMIAYDLLSLRKSTPRHSILSRAEVLLRYPGLDRDGLTGAALYYDTQIPLAERLGVELAVDAAALGADVLTHWAVTSIRKASQGMDVGLRDALTGRDAMVSAAVVVNCAGPGVDAVLAMIGDAADHARLVRGSKGSHLLVPRFPGAPSTGIHYEARSDGRAVLVLPIGDDCLIGATDTFVDGDPADAICTDDDVRYLLDEVNQILPQARLTPEHVVRTWCGVRPLPYSPDSASTAEISRDHRVVADPALPGLFSVVGGKLTTHRALGELVLRRIARDVPTLAVRTDPRRASRRRRLPGGRCASWPDFADRFRRTAGLDADVAEHLLEVYGVRARKVVALASTHITVRFPPRGELPPGLTIPKLPALGTTWYERGFAYWARRAGMHMHLLVESHGQPGWVAALTPLSVDGMIVAASTTLLADSRCGPRGPGKGLQDEALQWALANRGADGRMPTGRAIADQFGRHERWSRLVKRRGDVGWTEARTEGSAA